MNFELKIVEAVRAIVEELYGQPVPEKMVRLQQTRPEFEGQVTLVVFPFTKMSHKAPEATGQEIGQAHEPEGEKWLVRAVLRGQGAVSWWLEPSLSCLVHDGSEMALASHG